MNINLFKQLVNEERVAFKKHAVIRMSQRKILVDEVKETFCQFKVIEEYPHDRPLPSYLILGYNKNKRPLHLVVAIDEKDRMLWIITVYEPVEIQWEKSFEERRKK